MRTCTITTVALLFMVPVPGRAQHALTGQWQGETPTGVRVALDLKAEDETLTGTLTYGDSKMSIQEGKITKAAFSFKAAFGGANEPFSGELGLDTIAFWPDRLGRERATILKRLPAPKKERGMSAAARRVAPSARATTS